MDKKIILSIMLLLFISTNVFSITIDEIKDIGKEDNAQIINSISQVNSKIELLQKDIQAKPSSEELLKYLNGQVAVTEGILEQHKSTMLVSQILINISTLILGLSIYFYYKSKGRT